MCDDVIYSANEHYQYDRFDLYINSVTPVTYETLTAMLKRRAIRRNALFLRPDSIATYFKSYAY